MRLKKVWADWRERHPIGLLRNWPEEHPFMLAMIVLLVITVPGFARIEQAVSKANESASSAESASAEAKNASAQAKAVSERNSRIIACVTKWVRQETNTLIERDAVNKTARAASQELWDSIHGYIQDPPTDGQLKLLATIERYQKILNRVDKTSRVNPYPKIIGCLKKNPTGDSTGSDSESESYSGFTIAADPVAYVMMDPGKSGKWDNTCFGKRVTIYGTFGDDNIHGTDGPDVIFSYSGDDLILAGRGNDWICSRGGDDVVNAGKDIDHVNCGPGVDFALQAEYARACE